MAPKVALAVKILKIRLGFKQVRPATVKQIRSVEQECEAQIYI